MLRTVLSISVLISSGCASVDINDPSFAKRMVDYQCVKSSEQRALDRSIMDSRTMPTGVVRLYCGEEMKHIGL